MSNGSKKKARALGINHVVLEVGDLEAALSAGVYDFAHGGFHGYAGSGGGNVRQPGR